MGWPAGAEKGKYKIRRRCAWCKKDMGEIATDNPESNGQITDGLCEDCFAKHFPEYYTKNPKDK